MLKNVFKKIMKKLKNMLKKIIKVIVKSCIYLYCKIIFRTKIVGKENIPKEGAVIFCGNHRTYLDPQLIVATAGRDMRFMAKEELAKNPFFRFLGNVFDAILVKRDEKDITALKEALKTLKAGKCIGIFPEGTRNGFEKNAGEIKNGTAYMALKTGAKVVPIGIVGTSKPFSKNRITYGNPLDLSIYAGNTKKIDKEDEEKVSEIIKNEIIKLASIEI